MNRIPINLSQLQKMTEEILILAGVPAPDAMLTADVLLDAERSGVVSHGLMRLEAYIGRIQKGLINTRPDIVIKTRGAVAMVDGGNGLGQVVAMRAMEACIALAKEYGIGAAAVCNSNHFGTAAYYSSNAARRGCLGFIATNAGPTMAPFGGIDLLLGTNPFSVAFPAQRESFCADMAMSTTAKGKVRMYQKEDKELPTGWATDAEGNDTTDPATAIDGILLPMGGHKGYALAMAIDALCGLLSDARLSGESESMFATASPAGTGHFVVAIDIAHFVPLEHFEQRAQRWFDRIRDSRCRPGVDEILIPGELEARKRQEVGETLAILDETYRVLCRLYEARK